MPSAAAANLKYHFDCGDRYLQLGGRNGDCELA